MEWLSIALSAISAIVLPFVFFTWRQARDIRTNDLHAINERLDRIEAKLDTHLQYHLEHPPIS